MSKKTRLPNFELLRIIAMAMIVLLHCNYWMIGSVGTTDIEESSTGAFLRILVQQICIVGANVFVMISGWFAIKPTVRGGGNFVYQVVYHSITILLVAWLIGFEVTKPQILQSLALGSWNWFVPCYLGLYILSPVLNSYVKNTPIKTQTKVLLVFVVFEALYGWVLKPNYFNGGYSIISFIGLYLLARYLRLREDSIQKHCPMFYFMGYVLMTLIPASTTFLCLKYTDHAFSFVAYSSPVVIIASTFLFLCFSQLKISKCMRLINWGATSMFAVIMIHVHPAVVQHFRSYMKSVYESNNIMHYAFVALAVTILIIIGCVLADQPRIFTWNKLWNKVLNPILIKFKTKTKLL